MNRLTPLILLLSACDVNPLDEEAVRRHVEAARWVEPCHDEAMLLATTTGSPSHYSCPNQRHKMRVEVATDPTSEEAAALVFCECVTP